MTKPSLSWIDRSKVSTLLGRMASPKPSRSVVPAPPAIAPTSTRTLPPPMPQTTAQVQAAMGVASPMSGPVSVPRPGALARPVLAEFARPKGTLETRLEQYVQWVAQTISCDAVFVADENGLPVVSHAEDPVLIAVTAPCMGVFDQAWRAMGGRGRARKGRLVLAIEDDKLLHVAETSTPWGRFGVAVISPNTVQDDVMQCIQRGLGVALSEEESQG